MSGKYISTTLENQKSLTQNRLSDFLDNPESKIFFMNEPVGYGKTTSLIDLCLTPKNDGSFRRSVFLTYSNRKAAELEGEFLERIEGQNIKPRILRVFGESHIHDEHRYREENDISNCHNSKERERELEKGASPFMICERRCKVKSSCPYYRTTVKARSNVFDILIGNLNEMQTSYFYTDDKFKFPMTELLILDEDAVRKAQFEYSLPAEQMVSMVDFLPEIPKMLVEDKSLEDLDSNHKNVLLERFDKVISFFKNESGFYTLDGNINKAKVAARGFDAKKVSAERSRSWFQGIDDEAKEHRKESWYRPIKNGLLTDARIELQKDPVTGRAQIYFFPNLKDYKYILSQVGFTNLSSAKIVITDATSAPQEIITRFQLSEEEFSVSYDPLTDGFIVPKGKIYQIVENVSKSKYLDKDTKDLKSAELANLLSGIKTICDALDFSKTDTWIIPFKEFSLSKEFHQLSSEFGFNVGSKFYHGAVRGLNELKEKDIIILGSNFPRDDDLRKQQLTQLSAEVAYSYIDDFLQWQQDETSGAFGITVKTPRQIGIKSWMDYVDKDYGKLGRKVYLENVIQSMRSRFFWNETKTLIFSAYPLTDFGIVPHGLMSRDDFRNEFVKKVV